MPMNIFQERRRDMSEIEEKLSIVRRRIESARARSLWKQPVELVAVTKFHPLPAMEEAAALGVASVGENRVQELEEKRREGHLPVRWYLIGHLQKNKVRKAVMLADLIQSADSLEILREIDKRAAGIGKMQEVLLEFNISGEAAKHGFPPEALETAAKEACALSHVRVRGLMCMAPHYEDPEATRPVFRRAREMWETMKGLFPEGQVTVLSMGMTNDFEIAVEEGSTMVRVGTAIFGQREY